MSYKISMTRARTRLVPAALLVLAAGCYGPLNVGPYPGDRNYTEPAAERDCDATADGPVAAEPFEPDPTILDPVEPSSPVD